MNHRGWSSILALAVLVAACSREGSAPSAPLLRPGARSSLISPIPPQGTASTLDIGNWNLEWFGDTGNGPTNDPLQQQNVHDVIAGLDMDIWGLEEVVDTTTFRQLVAGLPGYTGVVANDPVVQDGATYYDDFNNAEQKVALVWKSSIATLVYAKVILANQNANFAGRPPVEFKLHLTAANEDLIFIVMHCKAGSTTSDWNERQAASPALKSYLDTTYPTQKVFVIGDWNDDVDVSITSGKASPYINFVNDSAHYFFPTRALTLAGVHSETSFSDFIDHQMVTHATLANYVPNSAQSFHPEAYVANYGTTTSDHYPTLSRWTFASGGGNIPPTASFTSSCSALTCTFTDASTDADGTIASRSWDFGDGQSSTATNPSHTYSSAGSYTVSLTVTDNGSATGSTTQSVTVSSGGPAKVILNEVLANEPGSNTAGEAIEIVNVGGTAISIAGWTLSDGTSVRHTFAAGTTLQPGKAISVFGGASAIPSGIVAVAASTGGLSLANAGDRVILKNGAAVVDSMSYASSLASSDGVSINRSPDGSATGVWVKHNTISTLPSSIGKHANGVVY
jgi:PKD repeat protein